ncbi:MAG: Cdc6/Cdc18 family protein [Candidatus Hodarchaeales archaeon]|jgi:cell division control protein 6
MTHDEQTKFDLTNLLNNQSSIFKDETVFEPGYVPKTLPHRENELETLVEYFRTIIYQDVPCAGKVVVILGPPGSGKTVTGNYFGQTLREYCLVRAKEDPAIAPLLFIHVNGRRTPTWHQVFTSILRGLVSAFPPRGFSASELLSCLAQCLNELGLRLLLCVDEVDYLLSKPGGQEIFYALVRPEENHKRWTSDKTIDQSTVVIDRRLQTYELEISLILITRNSQFMAQVDDAIQSSLAFRVMIFEPYTLDQVRGILTDRAQAGLNPGTYSSEILETISYHNNGDARQAIEQLWRSGKQAEKKGSYQINMNHVFIAIPSIRQVEKGVISDLSTHLKLLLLAIGSLSQEDNTRSYVTTPEVQTRYEEICDDQGESPRRQTQLWTYLQHLQQLDLVKLDIVNAHTTIGKSLGRKTHIKINFSVEEVLPLLLDEIPLNSLPYTLNDSTEDG